jgi:hypothetical protein
MAKDMYRVTVKNMSLCCLLVERRLWQPTFSIPKPTHSPLKVRDESLAPWIVTIMGQLGEEA